jgi:hypothetical protein
MNIPDEGGVIPISLVNPLLRRLRANPKNIHYRTENEQSRNLRPTTRRRSKSVIGLEFALIDGGFFSIGAGSDAAVCPTQVKIGAKGKDHFNAVEFGLETYAFSGAWKSEAEGSPKNYGV